MTKQKSVKISVIRVISFQLTKMVQYIYAECKIIQDIYPAIRINERGQMSGISHVQD